MLSNLSLKGLRNLSKPVVVRVTAILLVLSISLPMVMFSEWQTTKAKSRPTVEARPDVAPPLPYIIAGEKKGIDKFAATVTSYAQQVGEMLMAAASANANSSATEDEPVDTNSKPRADEEPAIAPEAEKKTAAALSQPAGTVDFDYNADAKSDVSRWDPVNKIFQVNYSGGSGFSVSFGLASSGAKPAPADYDADGKTDAAVFDSGTWYINKSTDSNPTTITTVPSFGQSGDIPMSGNYIGAASTNDELAVYRPSNGTWYWREVGNSTVYSQAWGNSGDIPVSGDFHSSPDGKLDFAIYRPSTGYWWILYSNGTGHVGIGWGLSTDIPVAADYDGDGRSDCAVFRPSTGTWWVLKSSDLSYTSENWGNWADQPSIGDFNGDGQADLAVWRPSSGVWYVDHTDDATFEYHTLGSAGNSAANSAYVPQVGGSVSSDALSLARLAPRNATGSTDLYSQNFSWGRNLVSLPGRSGLDLNIGLSYNSLVWTKEGSTVHFDTNYDNVTPGFNLGFPTIEPAFYDSATGKWNYLMITPSGARVQFRQTSASSIYETVDSSYLRLKMDPGDEPDDPPKEILFDVYGTDGTRMSYGWAAGAFRCVKITDRNGNYLSMVYNLYGYLESATDTLGRIVTVNYDSQFYPTSITQTWKTNNGGGSNTTHTWATFTYTTAQIQTDFANGISVAGPPNGTDIKVLEKVIYPDTSWTKFLYNEYGQVEKIENYADDDHKLSHVSTNLDSLGADQPDCPRFTATRSWVENFNLSGGAGTEQEVVVTNTAPASDSTTLPGSLSVSGKYVDVGQTGHPDGLYSRIWYGSSGYKEGLNLASEDCTGTDCAVVKRWTWSDWAHDDPYSSTAVNPRVKESRVGDGTNTKRSTVKYLGVTSMNPVATYGLVEEVNVFAADLSTVIKKSTVSYNLSSHYTDLRVLGLPEETNSWGWNDLTSSLEHVSKVTYAYDEGSFSDTGLQQNITPVQHDSTNYGTTHISGRGNLTSTTRWDVINTSSSITTATLKYNTAGSVVAKITPWDGTNTRTVKIGYTDNWNSGSNPTTYAYPTSITDPADNSSTVKYRYDIGANVEATSRAPAGQTYGKTTKRVFDSIGRLERNSIYVNTTEYSYVRYEYPTSGVHSKVFSTLIDTNSNGPDTNDEVLSESWFDGAGRTRMSRVPHTFSSGNPATWAGTITEYDVLGRVKRQSVPTEVNSSFAATGDDASRGFLWNQQEYDWMGRTTRTIPTDSNGSDGKDTLISYAGCGCAGGLETTVQGPLVPRDDQPTVNARRKQKSFADILGRTWKTQTFDWDGDAYLTTEVKFNGRDQALEVEQTDEVTSITQTSTSSFDGHGRLYQSHRPEQRDNSNNLKYTTYSYNLDDSILSVTDGRGAATNFEYNSRGLLTEKSWTVPTNSGITDPADVTFSYDNLGNRTDMTDGMGSVSYEYSSLSQLTSETRQFSDTLTDAPLVNSVPAFQLTYEYEIGGQLSSYTDPYGKKIEYDYQKTGRISSVGGTSFAGVTTYANNVDYRAWGALKNVEYGSGRRFEVEFNDRLTPSASRVLQISTPTTRNFDKDYSYYADGRLSFVDETHSANWDKFDRSFNYDHEGRVTTAESGIEAHGSGMETDLEKLPYRQFYTYNAFGGVTGRDSTLWNYSEDWWFSYNITNNRIQYRTYDNDGRMTADVYSTAYVYDAAGTLTSTTRTEEYDSAFGRDGDGAEIKRSHRNWNNQWGDWSFSYFVRSSVLGQIVSEVGSTGKKETTYVIAEGSVFAKQTINTSNAEGVAWKYRDASGLSTRSGGVGSFKNFVGEELDGLGNNVGTHPNYSPPDRSGTSESPGNRVTFDGFHSGDCELDGILTPCSITYRLVNSGAVQIRGRYWNSKQGFVDAYFDFDQALPGRRSSSIWIPNELRGEGSEPTVGEENTEFDNWESRVGVSGQWLTFEYIEDYQYLGDEQKLIDDIKRIINYAKKKSECTKAFEAIKATPIADQLNNLTIVTENTFGEPLYDKNWTRRSDVGKQFRSVLKAKPNTKDISTIGSYMGPGQRFIGITKKAAEGKDERLSVVVIHSLLHTGGIDGSKEGERSWGDWWNGATPHDLKYKGDLYTNVLKHCTTEGGSKNIYGV